MRAARLPSAGLGRAEGGGAEEPGGGGVRGASAGGRAGVRRPAGADPKSRPHPPRPWRRRDSWHLRARSQPAGRPGFRDSPCPHSLRGPSAPPLQYNRWDPSPAEQAALPRPHNSLQIRGRPPPEEQREWARPGGAIGAAWTGQCLQDAAVPAVRGPAIPRLLVKGRVAAVAAVSPHRVPSERGLRLPGGRGGRPGPANGFGLARSGQRLFPSWESRVEILAGGSGRDPCRCGSDVSFHLQAAQTSFGGTRL